MKNRLMLLFAALLAIAAISGCTYGSGVTRGSVEVNTFSKMSMSYQKFSGYKTTKVKVGDGEAIEVSVAIVTTEGKLDLEISKKTDSGAANRTEAEKGREEETIYQGTDLPTSDFKVKLDKPGNYEITVEGDEHKGSYKITWDKIDQEK
ncbi:hypothetical protein CLHUN_26030 [Ruminiclostridium hungatei]|uniref:Lipoprotein n=1 Tax=Ruminiclostridium hungatei TaxID=48256 RepID=A0A1V4SIX3_RUMHU|nr:hypothetical protein [Ruminiclostridium hungatei]OPX43456.1 hypothetical protein CLHUN_26030 [Ruminiclostridium hungatei]